MKLTPVLSIPRSATTGGRCRRRGQRWEGLGRAGRHGGGGMWAERHGGKVPRVTVEADSGGAADV
jgi:hypothetical protein